MTAVIETTGLGKRYRRVWALADCTLSIPAGHVVGLSSRSGRADNPTQPRRRGAGRFDRSFLI